MQAIMKLMSAEHRACDDKFAHAEQAVYSNNWNDAESAFQTFRAATERHFRTEEELIFPALLAAGGPNGPVHVMNMEHAQMNSLLGNMATALRNHNTAEYSGLSETLLILMQQHNLKEEQILYPIADRLLGQDSDTLTNLIQSIK